MKRRECKEGRGGEGKCIGKEEEIVDKERKACVTCL